MSLRPLSLLIVTACAVCLWPATSAAQASVPVLTAPVNDFAHIVDAGTARELERRIRALHAATGDTVVVATVRTIEPHGTIEEYAVRMFENEGKGIGGGRDNGVLILIAVEQRQIRIEVGYELEEFIPDGYAGEIIRSEMRPAFQRGNYSHGILLGTTRVIDRIAEGRNVSLDDRPAVPTTQPSGRLPLLPILFIIMLLMMMGRGGGRRRRRRRGPWSGWQSGVGPFGGGMLGGGLGGFGGGFGGRGGGFGGGAGFGGFGGGRSGGGGASGGW